VAIARKLPISPELIGSTATERIVKYPEKYRLPPSRALRSHVVLRSRYAEDRLFEALQSGIDRFVSIGAGYDTFAYRQLIWAVLNRDFSASGSLVAVRSTCSPVWAR
jgi:hypothetical protein